MSGRIHGCGAPEGGPGPNRAPAFPADGQASDAALRIEDALQMHIGEILALERTCFSDPWREEDFRSLLDNPQVYFRAACMAGRVVGYLVLIFAADMADLANLAVSPEHRRSGIGAALLDDALRFCKTRGIRYVALEVRESNEPARALYESRGFAAVGRRRWYYRKPIEDAIVMALELGE